MFEGLLFAAAAAGSIRLRLDFVEVTFIGAERLGGILEEVIYDNVRLLMFRVTTSNMI